MSQNNNARDLNKQRLMDAWAIIQQHADAGMDLLPNSYRLAFNDPEFLARQEVRGVRLQLELLKPELAQQQHQIDHTVVVYGSARVLPMDTVQAMLQDARQKQDAAVLAQERHLLLGAEYYEAARSFARIVARYSHGRSRDQHFYICTGGGPGIMEAANRGAHEAGEPTIGLNITLPHEQSSNPYITPGLNFKFHYFALRKMHFMLRAKALVTFPGGFGTLDELFVILTLVQTGKSKQVPIVLYGSDYWRRVLHLEFLAEAGMIDQDDLRLLRYADTPQEAWEHIVKFYRLASV